MAIRIQTAHFPYACSIWRCVRRVHGQTHADTGRSAKMES
jgi:hypothetical protein